MAFKILCTGNPEKNTLAKAVKEIIPTADCISLSSGYDFRTSEGLEKFRKIIKNYNVFINASRIDHGIQTSLLKITRDEWNEGHVFNIGSVLEYDFFKWFSPEGHIDKNNLRQLSLDLSSKNFKTTHIITGGFTDQSPQSRYKMDPKNIVNMIQWILTVKDFQIPIIGIENDYWLQGQPDAHGEWHELKQKGLKLVGREYDLRR